MGFCGCVQEEKIVRPVCFLFGFYFIFLIFFWQQDDICTALQQT